MTKKALSSEALFGEEQLVSNRRGTMTDKQVRLLRWPLLLRIILQWIILVVLYGGAAYGIVSLSLQLSPQTLYGIAGAAALPVLWLIWVSWRRFGSVSRREVASVAGLLTRETRNTDKGKPVFEIVIEKRRFPVSQEAYDAFEDGATYRVYYQPKIKTLMTAEKV